MAISKIKPKSALKGLKPLIIIIILTAVLNIFYTGGTPIIEGWIITWEGIARAVMMSLLHYPPDRRNVYADVHYKPHRTHRRT